MRLTRAGFSASAAALALIIGSGVAQASPPTTAVDGRESSQEAASASTSIETEPLWLNQGPIYQYPAQGGTWQYGFWNAKVRSYYTVNKCHGSTVRMDNRESRSVDTASGRRSVAELWAINYPGADDRYYYRVC